MNQAIEQMLARYRCASTQDYLNALKEILQELALLGLWRAKFFEHAAFYGGTALRVLYGLNRFSEDLDFSLLTPQARFSLQRYNTAIRDELGSFGFTCTVESVAKSRTTAIQSAFIKADTRMQFMHIGLPEALHRRVPASHRLKIKIEIDTDPPGDFHTEVRPLLQPIPFNINVYQLPDLFAGKLHAVLCRAWKTRIKGRDWYDFVWYVGRQTRYRVRHLQARLVQTHHWPATSSLTHADVQQQLHKKIDQIDWSQARNEVRPFLTDSASVEVWSPPFFHQLVEQLQCEE